MSEAAVDLPRLFTDAGLVGGECGGCGRRHFPLARWCPWCGDDGATEVALSAAGTLWSFTVVHAAPPGYDGPVPFGFGVVELPADGLRVVSRLTTDDATAMAVGDPVSFTTVDLGGDVTTWAFGPPR